MQPLVLAADLPSGLDPMAVESACAAIRAYCEWHIAPSVVESVTVDGSGGCVQFLPTLHLTALSSIENDGVSVTAPEWSAAGMVRGACWTGKFRGVTATMTHGYDSCPDEIVGVVVALASQGLVGVPSDMRAGPFQMGASGGASALSPAHRAVLDRYRIPPRP